MSKEIVIMLHEYKVRFSAGNKPNIIVVLSKDTSRGLQLMLAEFVLGVPTDQTQVELGFSTDTLGQAIGDMLSIAITIKSPATEYQKSAQNMEGDVVAGCAITSQHPANKVRTFFQNCKKVLEAGSKIPIVIATHKEKAICVLFASSVTEFSWKQKFQDLEFARKQKSGYVN